MAAKNVELTPADQFSSKDRAGVPSLSLYFAVMGVLFGVAGAIWLATFERRSDERTQVTEYQKAVNRLLEELYKQRSSDKHT